MNTKTMIEKTNGFIMKGETFNLFKCLNLVMKNDEKQKVQCIVGFWPVYTKRPAKPATIMDKLTHKELFAQVNSIQYKDGIVYILV